jgi:hypothetical protein
MKPRVHFLYDACPFVQSEPGYRLDIWCACHDHFGSDIAAALTHIPVDALPKPPSEIVQALAKSVTGARSWVTQAQRSVEWLLDNQPRDTTTAVQLENVYGNLQRAAWVLHDPEADEHRANEPQPHTTTHTQYCLACGKDHTEASAERLNQESEGR